jgi:hypothetical protein
VRMVAIFGVAAAAYFLVSLSSTWST